MLVVATAGSYIEEAIGLGVQLGDNELQLLLPDFTTGLKLEGLRVTPISTLAVSLARFHVAAGQGAADAHREALQHLHKHFGDVDWATVTPVDLSAPGVTNLSPEARAGLILSGLSWLAKQQAEASDLTPGLTVNAATLTSVLALDAADGTFDGRAGSEQLKQAKVPLTALTLRAELVQAMSGFINSPRNASVRCGCRTSPPSWRRLAPTATPTCSARARCRRRPAAAVRSTRSRLSSSSSSRTPAPASPAARRWRCMPPTT